jgi:acyl-CoA synthetase (AMP-forming)/AMP-acid ligase II
MIHTHSPGRAARYHASATALVSGAARPTFHELHARVGGIAAALRRQGFGVGDRLALLLPNEIEYLELVYACAWLGVVVVPLNTRLSATEIDRVLADATPHGLIRHSSLPAPSARLPWERVLDVEPLEVRSGDCPAAIYDPEAIPGVDRCPSSSLSRSRSPPTSISSHPAVRGFCRRVHFPLTHVQWFYAVDQWFPIFRS